jgi:drug/metabolite transporter (DMT)-like permease
VTLRVIILALVASGFTAMASVAQRRAAAPAPGAFSYNLHLVGYLLRRPVWFLGILCMILGFVFQVAALRVGSLSVVQPVIATELVIVFGVIALHDPHRVHWREWPAWLTTKDWNRIFEGLPSAPKRWRVAPVVGTKRESRSRPTAEERDW